MKEVSVVAVMLTAELLDVMVNTVSKAAMKKGMNNFVFVIFSNQMFKFFGIGYSSPTLASALSDLIPAFTFILAIFFRMEKLDWKANSTLAKSIGTVVSIAGALIISLYKGQAVINNHPPLKLFPQKLVSSMSFDWTRIVREYPAELVVVLIRITLTSILSVPAALISVKDLKALRLGFNMELIAMGCSAIFVLSFRSVIHTWAMGKRGPVYVAMFMPLEIVFAFILGITFLGDSLYIGSVIGAAIVVIGFYGVIGGKFKRRKIPSSPKQDTTMKELVVVAALMSIELLDVIVYTVSKAAMKKGMNDCVLVMYSNAFAAFFILPLTLIFYRKRALPPLTYHIVGLLFLNGLISCSVQMLRFFGIGYSSPTLASAMSDLIPAFTFLLAIVCRMEKLNWKANSTRAKSIGTFVSISGALIISLYKGQAIINNHPSNKLTPKMLVSSEQFDWIIGAVFLAAHSFILSFLFILQTWIIQNYPAELVVVLTRSTIVSLLSVPASLISEKDPKALRLGFDVQLLAIGCTAIFSVSFRTVTHMWVMRRKGPVYVAMFKPIGIVFAVILGITFLGDSLYLGSVIGAAVVVIGFYAVIWGKSQEKAEEECQINSSAVDPLLPNKTMED
ncbi:WAT1-related protein, partial [Mucuna pruriens]